MTTHFKVEMQYGYAIYSASDEAKAWDLFKDQGIRIFKLRSIHDSGILLDGPPVVVDLDYETRRYTAN